jgi:hypothetical protein
MYGKEILVSYPCCGGILDGNFTYEVRCGNDIIADCHSLDDAMAVASRESGERGIPVRQNIKESSNV